MKINLTQKEIELLDDLLSNELNKCKISDKYTKYFDLKVRLMINPLTKKPYKKQYNKYCPKGCGNNLFKTDVKGYKYVCLFCNENIG